MYHLRNLFRIRRYLTEKSASMVVDAFITSRLDHCNSLYFGLPKYQVKRLQQLQNTSARFVTKAGKYDHITALLVELRWLPVSFRIVFKLLLLVYKILNGLSPSYLSNFVQYQTATRSLRSNSQELLIQPMAKTSGVLALVWQGRPTVNLAPPPVCYNCEFTRNINIQLSIIWYFIIYFWLSGLRYTAMSAR